MKVGDLVRYDSTRCDGLMPGLVIKLYYEDPVNCPGGPDREMADVLFPYGVVGDDTYEFEVARESR